MPEAIKKSLWESQIFTQQTNIHQWQIYPQIPNALLARIPTAFSHTLGIRLAIDRNTQMTQTYDNRHNRNRNTYTMSPPSHVGSCDAFNQIGAYNQQCQFFFKIRHLGDHPHSSNMAQSATLNCTSNIALQQNFRRTSYGMETTPHHFFYCSLEVRWVEAAFEMLPKRSWLQKNLDALD